MAHSCPDCGCLCHCNGDVDDIEWDETADNCVCCADTEIDFCDPEDDHLWDTGVGEIDCEEAWPDG